MKTTCELDLLELDGRDLGGATNGKKPVLRLESIAPTLHRDSLTGPRLRLTLGEHSCVVEGLEFLSAAKRLVGG